MTTDFLKRIVLFLVFVLAQALVLGGIHLFNCATPLLYVYFVMMFPRNYPKWALLLWSFTMGLLIDVLFNTPGLAAASITLIAAIQPYLLEAFTTQDSAENLEPTLKTLGWEKYTTYAVMTVLIFCIVIYSLEMFSFFNLLHWAMCIIGSTLITLVFIFTFEITRSKK
jgi:rod shape-determining protein MreD